MYVHRSKELAASVAGESRWVSARCAENRSVLVYNNFIALALLAATSLVAGFFAYVYSLKRQAYLLLWTAGWTLFALHYLGAALAQWVPDTPLQTALDRWLYAVAALFFFLGAQLYAQRKPWKFVAGVAAGGVGGGGGGDAPPLFVIKVVISPAPL